MFGFRSFGQGLLLCVPSDGNTVTISAAMWHARMLLTAEISPTHDKRASNTRYSRASDGELWLLVVHQQRAIKFRRDDSTSMSGHFCRSALLDTFGQHSRTGAPIAQSIGYT